jgi:hypothetical protein
MADFQETTAGSQTPADDEVNKISATIDTIIEIVQKEEGRKEGKKHVVADPSVLANAIHEVQATSIENVPQGQDMGLQLTTSESEVIQTEASRTRLSKLQKGVRKTCNSLLKLGAMRQVGKSLSAIRKSVQSKMTLDSTPHASTGLNETELRHVCATICVQIYDASSVTSFKLPLGAEVRFFTNHGIIVDKVVPAFAIVKFGKSLILAWRASKNVIDWITNFSCKPDIDDLWSTTAPNLRAHGGYTNQLKNWWSHYQTKIIGFIKDNHDITEIVFTGHSLGGGMATVAHVIVRSQLKQETETKWQRRCNGLTCRTIAFAPPMSISIPEQWKDGDEKNTKTKKFVTEISENTCNIIYRYDPIPHAFGDVHFLLTAIERTLKTAFDKKGVLHGFWGNFFETTEKMIAALKRLNDNLKSVLSYRQIGKILYYTEAGTEPEVLNDIDLVDDQHQFRNHIEFPEEVTMDELDKAHHFFPAAFADEPEAEQNASDASTQVKKFRAHT